MTKRKLHDRHRARRRARVDPLLRDSQTRAVAQDRRDGPRDSQALHELLAEVPVVTPEGFALLFVAFVVVGFVVSELRA